MAGKLQFKGRESLNLTASELVIAPAVSIVSVLAAGKFLPKEMRDLKHFVADRIVEPHLQSFEHVGGKVFSAYDTQNRRDLRKFVNDDPDLPNKPWRELSDKERSYQIADILTKTGLAFVAEGGAALGSQMILNKVLGTQVHPWRNVAIDTAAHAVAIGSFMTLLAPTAESFKNGIAGVLEKTLGMKKQAAKDTARTLTYVSAPSWLAYLTTLFFVNRSGGNGKSR